MYVCLYVCELNVCVYDFIMLQYMKVSCVFCFWLWNFVWTALCRLDSCTHHFQTQQQHHHISFNQKIIIILPYRRLNYRQKNVVSKWVIIWMVWSFWTEKKSFYVDSLSFLPRTLAQALCIYSFMETSVCLPWNFGYIHDCWPHSRRLWAGSDKSYLLSYVEIYIKLNGSGFFCQFEEKAK